MAPDPTGEAHDPQSATGSTTATASILVAHISISAADVVEPTLLSIAKHQICCFAKLPPTKSMTRESPLRGFPTGRLLRNIN